MAKSILRRHWPIALLLASFAALATLYSLVNPVFEAPDEPWHYRFVKHLADGNGLPVLKDVPQENVAGQEGGQPPLYYSLAALGTFWIDTSDLQRIEVLDPRGTLTTPGVAKEGHGLNMFLHRSREDFPIEGRCWPSIW